MKPFILVSVLAALLATAAGGASRPHLRLPYDLAARGSTVFVCPYTLQRLPSLWPDPDRFVPERFDGRLPHPYAFLPFGAGSRRCPAARYVPRHVEAVLAAILRAARLELASAPVAPRGLVALRPAEPVMIAVRA